MKSKTISVLAVLSVLLSLLSISVSAVDDVTFYVTSNKDICHPGETVDISVELGHVENMGGLEFYVKVPEGLTVIQSTVSIPDGLTEIIDSDGEIVIPQSANSFKWSYSAKNDGYTGTDRITILSFTCKLADDISFGEKTITLMVETYFDNDSLDEIPYIVESCTISIQKQHICVYDQKIANEKYIKTAGTCKEGAVYFYSCKCGEIGEETFNGEMSPEKHTGGTRIENAVPNDCKKDGYTGDIYCNGCDKKLSNGEILNVTGEHKDADNDGLCDVCTVSIKFTEPSNNVLIFVLILMAVALSCGVIIYFRVFKH